MQSRAGPTDTRNKYQDVLHLHVRLHVLEATCAPLSCMLCQKAMHVTSEEVEPWKAPQHPDVSHRDRRCLDEVEVVLAFVLALALDLILVNCSQPALHGTAQPPCVMGRWYVSCQTFHESCAVCQSLVIISTFTIIVAVGKRADVTIGHHICLTETKVMSARIRNQHMAMIWCTCNSLGVICAASNGLKAIEDVTVPVRSWFFVTNVKLTQSWHPLRHKIRLVGAKFC